MPQPSMADVARAAADRDGGITYRFDNDDYASPNACRKAMFKFRNNFYAFKAKKRREMLRLSDGRDETSMYDDLSCSVDETPKGWTLTISPLTFDGSKIVDANGEQIDWARVKQDREEPITQEEIDRILANMPKSPAATMFDRDKGS